jgi:signal transduction histidine kinase
LTLVLDQETAVRADDATNGVSALNFLQPYRDAAAAYPGVLHLLLRDESDRDLSGAVPHIRRADALHKLWLAQVAQPILAHPAAMRIDVVREERGKLLVDAIRNEVVSAQRVADDLVARRRSAASFAVAISFAVIVLFVIVAGSIALRAQRQSQHQQRLLQLQIEERNAALERSNAALQEFAYVASHDLQEPLRTVASFTELLRERYSNELDAVANEFIDFAVDGARRMRLLIDDILSYSRVTTHGKPLENADLRESVMRAIENLKLAIDERSADVRVGEMPSVLGDKAQLAQLFQNLIGNALKYGGNPPQVAVSARRDGEVWRVCVADNGIGIAPEHHQRVFRMFQRLHTREEYSGTGVGLAICRGIVERHGGRIWVESNTGAGATFCFTLHGAS